MLHKDEFISSHPEVHTGMDAYSTDGEKLGQVELLDEDSIVIEKGWFFPKDFTIRYDDVADIRGDDLIVSKSRSELEEWQSDRYRGWDEYERTARETAYEPTGREEETRIPLREEELEAERRRREGEVHLRKVVHTEMKHMEVPVQKEDVVIERVPADETTARGATEGAFREEDVAIPITEEEVEIRKRPVVKEEVRAHKEVRTQEKDVSGEVRKEDVEVERNEPRKRKR
jgi:uncharacterized protein (TIGR02271 family)